MAADLTAKKSNLISRTVAGMVALADARDVLVKLRAEYDAASAGWPAVLANLKSLLETGHVLPQAPWEMHAELRAANMAKNDPR